MTRRRRTSIFEGMVELASHLSRWLASILALVSYLLLRSYVASPLPAVTASRQMGPHLTSSMFRGLAMACQYFLPLVFVPGVIGSVQKLRLWQEVLGLWDLPLCVNTLDVEG